MSAYHIVIATERRTAQETPMGLDTSRLAVSVTHSTPTGKMIKGPWGESPEYVAGPPQLHTMSSADLRKTVGEVTMPPDFSDPQFVMVAEWDLRSPFVVVHKGDYSARTMGCAGWPDVTKDQYDATEVLAGRS